MAKRKKRRAKTRRNVRQEFGQITYYYETASWPDQRRYAREVFGSDISGAVPVSLNGRIKYTKRMFPTYEAATAHLVSMELGIAEETGRFRHCKPCKLIRGYRQGGQKYITHTKILAVPVFKRAHDERDRVFRPCVSSGYVRQQRRHGFPVREDLDYLAIWPSFAMRGSRAATSSVAT